MQKIILLRHVVVDSKNYKIISANQFRKWVVEYNDSDIKPDFTSKSLVELKI